MKNPFEVQLEAIVNEYAGAKAQSTHDDVSDFLNETDVSDLQTRWLAAIERASGKDSIYSQRARAINSLNNHAWGHLAEQVGVARSLLSDIRNDYLKSLEEIIHADVFGDFLEMASHLSDIGYKDPAAVLAGSTLEAHLRQLCAKFGIATNLGGKSKKTDTLNAELYAAGAYSSLDQKNVTAWLALRNSAAHGKYSEYDAAQVKLLIGCVQDFVTRNPAWSTKEPVNYSV